MLPNMNFARARVRIFAAEASRRLLRNHRTSHDAGIWHFIVELRSSTIPAGVSCSDGHEDLSKLLAADSARIYKQIMYEAALDIVTAASWPPWDTLPSDEEL
mgnify:CR=1 FL=1